tara:strand:+ start:5644 stop:6417 length:774 start_codon:yes stop_codon:yes gene_type:complete
MLLRETRLGSPDDFVKSYVAAWNSQDAPAVADHFSENGTYIDQGDARVLTRQSLAEHLVDYFSDDSYRYEVVGDVLFSDKAIAFQYRVVPLDPSEDLQGWGGAEFIELDGVLATRISDYYRIPGRRGLSNAGKSYAKSGLNDEAMEMLLQSLKTVMEVDEAFLDPDLSLPKLAERLNTSVNHVSQAINAGHSMSFFDYINRFRVAEAAKLLRQKECQFPAILDVALSVGFNSTSTFYTAFKKATGQTPAQYRRAHSG